VTGFRTKFTFEHFQRNESSNRHFSPPGDCNEAAGEYEVEDAIAVLVVEDEQLIQDLIEDALSEGGFKIVITASGEEAITLLKGDIVFRAVITDINLIDRLDGWEVARIAREAEPTIPIIYMSGTHGEDWASKGVPNSVLLNKPFAPAQIVTALSNLINAASPPAAPTQ
jgi:DNA-binding response OmpR family regulator